MNPHSQLPRVDELDGLRGLLATWVAISHILCWSGFAGVMLPPPFGRFWLNFIFAQPAVEVFIILSGFAISFLLHAKKQSYAGFMQGRFFRIYPTYFVCLAFGMGTLYLTPFIIQQAQWRDTSYFQLLGDLSKSERQYFLPHAVSHLTLFNGLIPHSLLPNATGTLLPPAWSVSLEWQYYLVAPLIAILVRSSMSLLVLSAIAYTGTRLQAHWLNPHLAFLPAQLPLFMIGIGSYHLYAYFKSNLGRRSNRFSLPAAALLSATVLLSWHSVALIAWGLTLGCIFIEGDGVFARTIHLMRTVLLHPRLQQLGRISYPLYLVHWPILILCLTLLLRWKPMVTSTEALGLMLLVALPIMLVVAGALHYFVEVPAIKFGKHLKGPGKAPEPAPSGHGTS